MDCSPPGSSVREIFLGKDTGVYCHFLLQGLFQTQGLNLGLLHCRQIFFFFFFFLSLHSVFQSLDTEQTGNGMGTSARLAFPPNSEAGRIQAILQMPSWEVRQIFLLTELQGKPHIEGYTSANLPLFGEFFDPELEKLYKCSFGASRPPAGAKCGYQDCEPPHAGWRGSGRSGDGVWCLGGHCHLAL